jgi:hypothetical protein
MKPATANASLFARETPGHDLSQEFRERLPVMCLPSRRESFRGALGKAGMVKDDLGFSALLDELEFRDRVSTWIPVAHSPGLDDARVRHKFDVSPHDNAAEKRERAAHIGTDYRRRSLERNGRLPGSNDLCDLVELPGVCKRFVDTIPARFENGFLMNGFSRAGNFLPACRPNLGQAQGETAPPNVMATPAIICRRVGEFAGAF